MKSAVSLVTDYVLEKLPAEPVHRRITITRALATLESDQVAQAALHGIANDLERVERRQRKLTLHFKRRGA